MTMQEIKEMNIQCNVILEALAWIDECSRERQIDWYSKMVEEDKLNECIENLSNLVNSNFQVRAETNGDSIVDNYIDKHKRDDIASYLINELQKILRHKK